MSISVGWDNTEKTAIRWDFEKLWSNEEIYSALDDSLKLLEETEQIVDLILNMEATSYFPKGVMPILNSVIRRCTQGTGVILLVDTNRYVQMIMKTQSKFDRTLSEGITFIDTLEEARALLEG